MSKSISLGLRHLFSDRCEFCKTCASFLEDSWYCVEDHGDHCGTARERRIKWKMAYPDNYVSLEMLFEEPKEPKKPRKPRIVPFIK